MTSHLDTLGQAVLESTSAVLADAGIVASEAAPCEPAGDWRYPMAVIGFGGETVRGSISFELPWSVLSASHPFRSTVTEDLVDWAGELANLVLGNLKTRLRGKSVAIQPGLPMTFTTGAAESGLTRAPQLQYRVAASEGAIFVRFSAEIDGAFEISPSTEPELVRGVSLF
jgi:CheY-specific phosphatase CheX